MVRSTTGSRTAHIFITKSASEAKACIGLSLRVHFKCDNFALDIYICRGIAMADLELFGILVSPPNRIGFPVARMAISGLSIPMGCT